MNRGFSLVELSIVLVILGLLTGGILAGQSLIRASELRAVTTEYQRYVAATQTFRDKYFAIPGDMTNATKFWGDNNTYCADAAITNGTPGTCNGSGDGLITDGAGGNATAEMFQYWNQLAYAGLIEGTYTGIAGATQNVDTTVGTNAPRSKISNAGWSSRSLPNFAGNANLFAIDYGNLLLFGGQVAGTWTNGATLKPEEAWNIDTKMDDGKPAQGKIIGFYWNNTCSAADDGSSANNDLVASYRLTDSSLQCALLFRQAF